MKPEELYDKLFLKAETEGDHNFNKELIRQAFAEVASQSTHPENLSKKAENEDK